MFIKLRKKFVAWLDEASNYDDNGNPWPQEQPEEAISVNRGYSQVKRRGGLKVATANQVARDRVEQYSQLECRSWSFKVYPGQGGIAIESSHFDERQDMHIITLHVVPEAEELSDTLSKIITMQAMRG